MIEVSRLNGVKYYVNAELIEFVEATPDTMITLASGKKLLVLESVREVIDRIIEYKQALFMDLPKRIAALLEETGEKHDGK
ncbi:MAG: flagellar FlbD family protein [Christensenellaceae bacterium]|jgi:flagellar protein FlbD